MNIDTLIELLLRHVTPSTIVILFITGAMFSLVPVWGRLIRILREPIPISHKIAVIGLPGAGKTTLITSLFELIQRGVHIPAARLHGGNTIRTVNKNVARLNAGQPIGPTTEDQTFVFRFSYKKGSKFLAHTYDVEIADFPGEYSDRISHQNSPLRENEAGGFVRGKRHRRRVPLTSELDLEYTLFNSEFFSWIASSREYLFLVDLASTYSAENVRASIADISARIRASWQVVEDAVSERGIGATSRREVHLVFTKLDSLFAAHAGLSSLSAFMDGVADISDEAASARMKELKSKIAEGGKRSDQSIIVSATPESYFELRG